MLQIVLIAIATTTMVLSVFLLVGGQSQEMNFRFHLGEDISDSIRKELSRITYVQNRLNEELVESLSTRRPLYHGPAESADAPSVQAEQLVRELSHSLGTPLAGTLADLVVVTQSLDPESLRGVRSNLERMSTAIDLCQAFLLSYRKLAAVEDNTGFLADADLSKLVERAANYYSALLGSDPSLEIELPSSVPPYHTYQVLAVLWPLIENALEGSSGGRVSFRYRATDAGERIKLTNAVSQPVPENFMKNGVTTKNRAEHSGLGMGVSARLAESLGWTLNAYEADGTFTASLDFGDKGLRR